MTAIFDIDDRTISPYKSSTNGKVESQNKRINTAMRASLTDTQLKDWDIWLPYIVFALNGLKSSKTSFSSNFLVYGREIRAPRDLWCDKSEFDVDQSVSPNTSISEESLKSQYAYKLHSTIRTIMNMAQKALNQQVKFMSKEYNKNVTEIPFKVNDHCYVKINVSKKWSARWTGPWKILKKISDHLFIVLVDGKEKVVSVTRMKVYKHSKYFPAEQEKGTQTGVKEVASEENGKSEVIVKQPVLVPEEDDSDSECVEGEISFYRPITGTSNVQQDRQLQREVDARHSRTAESRDSGGTASTRPVRTRAPPDRLTYPYGHLEANRRARRR